jgi:hypothetical protein
MLCDDAAMPITGPIFVRADDDLLVFRSKEDAESSIEAADVERDERAYDSQGRLLHVVLRERRRWWERSRAEVELIPAEDAGGHAEELRALLVDWLPRTESAKSDLASMGLQELIQRAERVENLLAAADMSRSKRMLAWLAVLVAGAVAVWLLIR